MFVLAHGCEPAQLQDRLQGTRVLRFDSERDMLRAWRDYVRQQDPDAFVLFQVGFARRRCLCLFPYHVSCQLCCCLFDACRYS